MSLFLVFSLRAGPAQDKERPQQTPEERQLNIDSFEHLCKSIYERHFDPTFGSLDWKAVRLELRPQIEAARSRLEARAVMQQMLSRLKLTHCSIPEKGMLQ